MRPIGAVLFDLYGTLIQVDRPVFQRGVRRLLDVDRRAWTEYVLGTLLVTPFDGREAFLDRILSDLGSGVSATRRAELLALLDDELASTRVFPGVRALLAFLRRRGLRLGLISNLASPYREPVDDLGLSDAFDCIAFSCDREHAKPDDRIYLELCRELGMEPDRVLVVGDSLRNDVRAPRRLGMRSLRVNASREARNSLPPYAIGWLSFEAELRPLVTIDEPVRLGQEEVRITEMEPVADDTVGRYNLVLAAQTIDRRGAGAGIYLKRYLLPDSAYVDEFSRALMAEAGIESPSAGIWEGSEPVLWSAAAPGEKVDHLVLTPELAFDIGRHGAAAFLFANADYRPRNAFLVSTGSGQRLMMVDYEHCLFNLALDVSGVENPLDPNHLDALGSEELSRRIRKRVISPRTCRRNYREFFGARGTEPDLLKPFRQGWTELTLRAQSRRKLLEELLRQRVYVNPFLIIGTQSYRRAMTTIDVEDLLSRLASDPDRVLAGWMGPITGA